MDFRAEFVRRGGNDRKSFGVVPAIPQSSEQERPAFAHPNVDRLFAAGDLLPFVKTIGKDKAAPLSEGTAEGW